MRDASPSTPEDKSVSSASLLLSPTSREPLVASTPLTHCNGVGREPDHSVINGNGNLVSESTNSIDVLSCGESDAGDTLSRSKQNNNSISSSYLGTLRDNTADRRKRGAHDQLYWIAKQLLMDERTYKRDLQLVTVSWSDLVSSLAGADDGGEAVAALAQPCLALEPVALRQGAFLAAMEKCMAASAHRNDNEEPEYKKIADILLDYLTNAYEAYKSYVSVCGALVGLVESARRRLAGAAGAGLRFDAHSPLPLAALLLRPLHALHRYSGVAHELSQCESGESVVQLAELCGELWAAAAGQLRHAENHAAMCQLQRDILGYDKLLVAGREFLRLGCVYKHSSKGLQQRMLFLFSDALVVCGRGAGGYRALQVLALDGLGLSDDQLPHSLTITHSDGTSLTLSASNEHEYRAWRAALSAALAAGGGPVDTQLTPYEQDDVVSSGGGAAWSGWLSHVCWHRATSLSRDALHRAMTSHLSGYLLRKFKTSHGWQKLWVVFAAFALYFYKSWQDDKPLASLPLLGYTVGPPTESDSIKKDFVFKLQFKNHVYFFRADSQYTYDKWTDILRTSMMQTQAENNNLP